MMHLQLKFHHFQQCAVPIPSFAFFFLGFHVPSSQSVIEKNYIFSSSDGKETKDACLKPKQNVNRFGYLILKTQSAYY